MIFTALQAASALSVAASLDCSLTDRSVSVAVQRIAIDAAMPCEAPPPLPLHACMCRPMDWTCCMSHASLDCSLRVLGRTCQAGPSHIHTHTWVAHRLWRLVAPLLRRAVVLPVLWCSCTVAIVMLMFPVWLVLFALHCKRARAESAAVHWQAATRAGKEV